MSEQICDVLVVGAGPVGLMMAAELRRHGVACRLVERLAKAAPYCKALGVTPRTLEIWDDLGIANQALTAGMTLKGLVGFVNGDLEHAEKSKTDLADGAYGFLTLAQYDAERILTEHLTALGGRIDREIEVTALAQQDDCVEVTATHADGSKETIHTRWVIGCDGGRSAVRRALKLEFEGEHYEQVFLLADVELDAALERGYAYKMARMEDGKMLGAGACIPVPGNARRYRVSTGAPESMIPAELTSADRGKEGISPLGPTLGQVQEVVDWLFCRHVGVSQMRWSAFYRISHRLVSQYRVGRVFLAGDAAHLHPPLGGQGMNTGLQDAYNLAWKLALVIRGAAAEELLESYNAERRAIGQQIVERTTKRMNQVMEGKVDEQEPIREDSQLFLNYRESRWVANDFESGKPVTGPVAGDRAPDVTGLRRAGARYEMRLFDVLRGPHHTLLLSTSGVDAATDLEHFAKLSATIENRFGVLIQTCAVVSGDGEVQNDEGLAMVRDPRGDFARRYGASCGSGYLIRPDGYIGYRAERITTEGLFGFLDRVFRDADG